jgi:hypothetical protein
MFPASRWNMVEDWGDREGVKRKDGGGSEGGTGDPG